MKYHITLTINVAMQSPSKIGNPPIVKTTMSITEF